MLVGMCRGTQPHGGTSTMAGARLDVDGCHAGQAGHCRRVVARPSFGGKTASKRAAAVTCKDARRLYLPLVSRFEYF